MHSAFGALGGAGMQLGMQGGGEGLLGHSLVFESIAVLFALAVLAVGVIVLGDLNDFTYSDSLQVLCGEQLTNLTGNLPAPDRYSYIYQGSAELIDHVLVSSALLGKGADVDIVHMNCEFPTTTQVSDHDPVVVRLHVPRPSPLAD